MRIEEERTGERDIEGLVLSDEELEELHVGEIYRESIDEGVQLSKDFYLLDSNQREVGKGRILKRDAIKEEGVVFEYRVTDLFFSHEDNLATYLSQNT